MRNYVQELILERGELGATPFRSVRMHLRAHECRERAMEARELARQAKRPSAKTAFENAAEYWLALGERVERLEPEQRRPLPLAQAAPRSAHPDSMPIIGYFLSVGLALFLGLVALHAYLESGVPESAEKTVHGSDHRVTSLRSTDQPRRPLAYVGVCPLNRQPGAASSLPIISVPGVPPSDEHVRHLASLLISN
jgi:hypothetical protein